MVKMIINLVSLEEDLKDIHHYVDHIAQEVPGCMTISRWPSSKIV
jgi:hypothetical protein